MKLFLIKIFSFTFYLFLVSELIIRIFILVPDIPERYIDENGIQRYKQNQRGYYVKGNSWEVNEYGWLGVYDTSRDYIISIIGDSYIENMMNPIECNQGSILGDSLKKYSFFEAGRSGVTFIESMEISEIMIEEISPQYQLIYLSDQDFYESLTEFKRYDDRLQISIIENKLFKNDIKSPIFKRILYNIKVIYYLYLKFPILVEDQNKKLILIDNNKKDRFNKKYFNQLFEFCDNNYNLNKLILVFRPETDIRFVNLANKYRIKNIVLKSDNFKDWSLGEHDGHWSCYGHQQVANQVINSLYKFNIINYK